MICQTNTQLFLDVEVVGSVENPNQPPKSGPQNLTADSEADLKRTEANRAKCRRWRLRNLDKERSRLRKWHKENQDREKLYRARNRPKMNAARRKWRAAHPDKVKEEHRSNRPQKRIWLQQWRLKNPERNKQYGRRYRPQQRLRCSERIKTDPQYAMAVRIRARLGVALRRQIAKKFKTTFALLGCSMFEFMARIELMFLPGMTWHNRSEWHLDHIVPCAAFNLMDEEEQSVCFNWQNFQPLWGRANLLKSDTIPSPLPSWLPAHIAERDS